MMIFPSKRKRDVGLNFGIVICLKRKNSFISRVWIEYVKQCQNLLYGSHCFGQELMVVIAEFSKIFL